MLRVIHAARSNNRKLALKVFGEHAYDPAAWSAQIADAQTGRRPCLQSADPHSLAGGRRIRGRDGILMPNFTKVVGRTTDRIIIKIGTDLDGNGDAFAVDIL